MKVGRLKTENVATYCITMGRPQAPEARFPRSKATTIATTTKKDRDRVANVAGLQYRCICLNAEVNLIQLNTCIERSAPNDAHYVTVPWHCPYGTVMKAHASAIKISWHTPWHRYAAPQEYTAMGLRLWL